MQVSKFHRMMYFQAIIIVFVNYEKTQDPCRQIYQYFRRTHKMYIKILKLKPNFYLIQVRPLLNLAVSRICWELFFLVLTYITELKTKKKIGVNVHLIEQRCIEVYLFIVNFVFSVFCGILIYILLCFIMTINIVLLHAE